MVVHLHNMYKDLDWNLSTWDKQNKLELNKLFLPFLSSDLGSSSFARVAIQYMNPVFASQKPHNQGILVHNCKAQFRSYLGKGDKIEKLKIVFKYLRSLRWVHKALSQK